MKIVLTPGEPAGIGPDITVMLAQNKMSPPDLSLITLADKFLLQQRADHLNLPREIIDYDPDVSLQKVMPGQLVVYHQPLKTPSQAGMLNKDNAVYVLQCLDIATEGCLTNEFDALVTGPVQKSLIQQAGFKFSGHTEYLAQRADVKQVVMMLASDHLRVALVTTHLPLTDVATAITPERLTSVIHILLHDLSTKLQIENPRIAVCGLNPHAGEQGMLGREEIEVIQPVIQQFKQQGFHIDGPFPADTLFTAHHLENYDAILSMFHDQGLPVIKHACFGKIANITLGLPFIRTSVDHGTALDLAGTGKAKMNSLHYALNQAIIMAAYQS